MSSVAQMQDALNAHLAEEFATQPRDRVRTRTIARCPRAPRLPHGNEHALYNVLGNVGGLLGPYVIGLIRARSDSFSGPVWFVAAVMACGSVLIALLHASERRLARGQ